MGNSFSTKATNRNQLKSDNPFNYEAPPILKGLHFSKEKIQKAKKENKLLSLSIETSNTCNLNCIYCYVDAGKKKTDELLIDNYKLIVDQAKQIGVETINIVGAGEPLLDKRLFKILDYIEENKIYSVLFTNCTLITPDIAKNLFKRPVSIVANCNSINSVMQNKLAGDIPWAYEKIQTGIFNLLNEGFHKVYPTRLAINAIVMKNNYEEIPEIFKWARKNNVFPLISRLLNSGRAKDHDLNISKDQYRNLSNQLLDIDKKEFGFSWKPSPTYLFFPCHSLYYHMVIDAQGNAKPCFGIFKYAGNIRNKSIEQLWNSDLITQTKNIKNSLEGKCKNCEIFDDCYGCRCSIFLETGNIFAEDTHCWY